MGRGARSAALVTGFPGPVARSVISGLAVDGGDVVVLARERDSRAAEAFCAALGPSVSVMRGDPGRVDLGLGGPEAAGVQDRLTTLFHLEETDPGALDRAGLRAAREIAAFAACGRSVRLVALAPFGVSDDGPGVLERVLGGRGADLGASFLRAGVGCGPEGPWPVAGRGRLLHLIVLLHLSVDIRRLRSVASRRLVLTWAPLIAEAALGACAGSHSGELDLTDPRPPSLSQVDRALSGMLDGTDGMDAEFLTACRRHRDGVIGRWIGRKDPVDVLASWTVAGSLGGGGERAARDLGLEWLPTLDVLGACLEAVVRDVKADLGEEAEVRDALLG
ncbi:MAG: hypothetical protein JRG91_00435 [Deltaproteobacteria bacterium]|nr:hypothetical protein [Deltaproteobacteria bacterium]